MGAILSHVFGHKNVITQLCESYKKNKLTSTFLFVGPNGVGKKLVARGLLQLLVCENPIQGTACSTCGPCLRLAKDQSESLMLVEPEKNLIKIEQSRKILDYLSLQTLGQARGVIIDHAECLNPQAANALLKILEEPPEKTYFFMLAPSSRHVISTLRSRAQVVHFTPLNSEDLRRKNQQAPDWIIQAAQGSIERMNQLQSKSELESREQASLFLEMWVENPRSYLLPEWREIIRDRSQALALSKNINTLLRDAMLIKLQSLSKQKMQSSETYGILNMDKMSLLKKISQLNLDKISDFSQSALNIESALLSNYDTQLVFESFWIRSFQ